MKTCVLNGFAIVSLGLAWLTACGSPQELGTAAGAASAGSTGNDGTLSRGGATASGGVAAAQSVTETTGGTQAQSESGSAGVATRGGTSAVGATTIGGSSVIGATNFPTCTTPTPTCPGTYLFDTGTVVARMCQNDSQCLAGEYCNPKQPAHQCTCTNGYWVTTWDFMVSACMTMDCTTPISSPFTSQLGGSPCDVVARVNADASVILSYKVVCGAAATVSQDALLSTLKSTSGATWQGAIAFGDTSKHFLFVDNANANHAIAFSGVTGLQLFEFSDASLPAVSGDWSNASDLDGSCSYAFAEYPFVALGPWQSSYPGDSVIHRVVQQGVFSGISTASGGERSVTVVHAGLLAEEYFVIISTSPRNQHQG